MTNQETDANTGRGGSLIDILWEHDQVVITASLELVNGRFLQPTGFPDIGPCIYRDKDGRRWCLVESEQSMANRLEAVCMKEPGVWTDELEKLELPVIAVLDPDENHDNLLTTNLCEPHRCASSYVLDGKIDDQNTKTMKQVFEQELGLTQDGDSWPLDRRAKLERLVFALDPGALLHGFQFVQWKFVGLRQTRLVHGRLEAELADEPEVHYGMVKWDAIEPEATREERANKGQSIAAKSRIVPKKIVAWFEIDLLGLKALALDDTEKKFLLGLALWKVGAFLGNKPAFDPRSRQTLPSLRLRADCYLRCNSISWEGDSQTRQVSAEELMQALPEDRPDFASLLRELSELSKALRVEKDACGGTNSGPGGRCAQLYKGPLVEVRYKPKKKKE
ncbi:type I-G CRISPR-associated RAMP protein Csb1/Cas7g [Thermoleophilum album]|uniref:CRISPR-associated protein Csb1 n=1 Tax=Thermoleophilum album TaxID=29539 RepID=A0A1H6FRZ3_THEAL|nr:type I-U CRISPR-associated RAMP protein Csb1/Cas7u [Thermoleophilum album]SEH13657.1 CRISPR-associated protein Csb1 [Thermoleophilum album]